MPKISQEPTVTSMQPTDYLLGNFNVSTAVIERQYLSKSINPTFYVMDYGAVFDGATDDTAAINNTITAAYNAGGGTVLLPSGTTIISSPLVLLNHVWLRGMGMKATKVSLANNAECNMIESYTSPDGVIANAFDVAVLDMWLYGNSFNQGSAIPGSYNGISFVTNPEYSTATNDEEFDMHHLVQNVRIDHCVTNGFYAFGRSEIRLNNVVVNNSRYGVGIFTSFDTQLTHCSSYANGLQGFVLGSSTTCHGCKSFENGTHIIGNGCGFEVNGSSGVVFSGCIAQNNFAQGFLLNNCKEVSIQGCNADSNNYGSGNTQGQYAGVEIIEGNYCIVDVTTGQGYQAVGQVGNQGWALRINGGSNYNDIRITQYNQPPYTALGMLSSDSVLLNNRIYTNGAVGVVGT